MKSMSTIDPDGTPNELWQVPENNADVVSPPVGPSGNAKPHLPVGHRGRRRAGLVAASLLVAGSGVVGFGAVAAQRGGGSGTATASARSTTQGPTNAFNGGGAGGTVNPQFDLRAGVSGTAETQETAAVATDAQSVGLVEISSTLPNGTAAGTGLILTSGGTVVTNHHVVAGATAVKVTVVSTGKTYTATYVGGDATADVAVLKLTGASGLTPIKLATTAAAANDAVTAVGDAGGDGGTLTASPGTVAALGQNISVQSDDGTSSNLTDLIEMNAYVVPGDSGGAVLNSSGAAVGMNVAASSGARYVTGYAIPIATVESIADQILAGDDNSSIALGYSGYLGVGLDPNNTAPVIAQVMEGGAAESAGIAAGDTITNLNGTAITSAEQLRSLVAKTAPGDRVTVSWKTSAGAARAATVTLGGGPIA
jgi:S1-C subfamily serine protease